jgi:hypothetical protein
MVHCGHFVVDGDQSVFLHFVELLIIVRSRVILRWERHHHLMRCLQVLFLTWKCHEVCIPAKCVQLVMFM